MHTSCRMHRMVCGCPPQACTLGNTRALTALCVILSRCFSALGSTRGLPSAAVTGRSLVREAEGRGGRMHDDALSSVRTSLADFGLVA